MTMMAMALAMAMRMRMRMKRKNKKMMNKKKKTVDPKRSSSTTSENIVMFRCRNCKETIVDPEPTSSSSSSSSDALSNIILVKRRKVNGKNTLPQLNSAASKFMSVLASDDLLLEIFLRLPNGRSATQLATVCKRWHSLIIVDEGFKTRFTSYHLRKQSHDSSYYPDYTNSTILYRSTCCLDHGHCYQVSSKKFAPKLYDISFIRNWKYLIIRATNGYLLLLSNGGVRQYLICNSLTRLRFKLPAMPAKLVLEEYPYIAKNRGRTTRLNGTHGFALVCNPLDIAENRYRYKVVIVNKCYFFWNKYHFDAAIYDSESGLWTQPSFSSSLPYDMGEESHRELHSTDDLGIVVSSNCVLHWIDSIDDGKGYVVVFDPSSSGVDQVKVVCFAQKHFNRHKCSARLGLVRGRIRVSLIEKEVESFFSLKVLELDSNGFSLVHDVVLDDTFNFRWPYFVLAFDPNHENALFFVNGTKIYRYEIDQDKFQLICGFSDECDSQEISVLTILHPLWPTPTLSLASTNQR